MYLNCKKNTRKDEKYEKKNPRWPPYLFALSAGLEQPRCGNRIASWVKNAVHCLDKAECKADIGRDEEI